MKVGDQLPHFEIANELGELVNSAELPRPLVLFFYPKNNTMICTREVCHFRDHFKLFADNGVAVFGVSSDNEKSHQNFIGKHDLPYSLLSDTTGMVRSLFGVKSFMGLVQGRVTYIINKEGEIIHIFSSPLQAEQHVNEALMALGIKKK